MARTWYSRTLTDRERLVRWCIYIIWLSVTQHISIPEMERWLHTGEGGGSGTPSKWLQHSRTKEAILREMQRASWESICFPFRVRSCCALPQRERICGRVPMCDCPVQMTTSLVKEGVPVPKNTESRHVVVGSTQGLETNLLTVVVIFVRTSKQT